MRCLAQPVKFMELTEVHTSARGAGGHPIRFAQTARVGFPESSTAYASLARSPRRPPRTLSEGTDSGIYETFVRYVPMTIIFFFK